MTRVTANAIEKLLKIINIDEKIIELYKELDFHQTRKEEEDNFLKWRNPKSVSLRQGKIKALSKIRGDIKKSLRHDIFMIKRE